MATSVPSYRLFHSQLVLHLLLFSAIIALQPWRVRGQWEDHCPAACRCNATALSVQCTEGTRLVQVPTGLPPQVEHLSLRGNRITHVAAHHLANLPQLRTLDLSLNAIHNISSDAFTRAPRLETLLLQGNLLELVPSSVFTSPIHTLDLSNNNISYLELPALSENATGALSYLNLSFNSLSDIPANLLASLPDLQNLDLQANDIREVSSACFKVDSVNDSHPLTYLNLANNRIKDIARDAFQSLSNLQSLDLSHNVLYRTYVQWFEMLTDLKSLHLSHNPLGYLPNYAFAPGDSNSSSSSLRVLDVSNLYNLSYVSHYTLAGLSQLQKLNLSHNPNLEFVHAQAFHDLQELLLLDLSHNRIMSLHPVTFQNLSHLQTIDLQGNAWSCDCEATWLGEWVVNAEQEGLLQHDLICSSPARLSGQHLKDIPTHNLTCEGASIANHTNVALVTIGSAVVLDCIVDGNPRPAVTWRTNRGRELHYQPAFVDFSDPDPEHLHYHNDHDWHLTNRYIHEVALHFHERILVLKNGSLYIDYITRKDGGNFTCFAQNEMGNDTAKVLIKLDYSLITGVKIYSIIFGFLCAVTFFTLTVLTSAIRFIVFFFSEKEKKKRRSIREVLEDIHNYKSTRLEQLSAYKSAKLGQLSAFKTAKIDQLTAFKMAKVEKLSAYKSAKIGKIRTYKQATVTNVLHHLHHMREYYTSQMCRIKENCSQQVDNLRDNYSSQMSKFKDYRSHRIDKIRENYHSQAVKIRDYSSLQMARLREQYKTQQLHILKLLELLDVGNCMTVIEAECMRTESMIFDPDITFDLEAHPVHAPRDLEESGDSEYLTAGTVTDSSSVASVPYVLSVHNESREAGPVTGGSDTVDSETPGQSSSHPSEAKVKKKKRRKKKPLAELPVDLSCDSLAEPPGVDIAKVHGIHTAKSTPPPTLPLTPARGSGSSQYVRESSPGQDSTTSADYASAQASRDQSPEAGGATSTTVVQDHSRPPPVISQSTDATAAVDQVLIPMGPDHTEQLTDNTQQAKETVV